MRVCLEQSFVFGVGTDRVLHTHWFHPGDSRAGKRMALRPDEQIAVNAMTTEDIL